MPLWLAGGVAVALVLAFLVHSFDLAHLDPQTLADRLRATGALGPLLLMLLLVTQAVVAPIPAPPILIAAGYVYGPWVGFAIGFVGLLIGAAACFVIARTLGRPFAERFVSAERLAAADQYVTARAGATLLTLVSMRVFMPPAFDPVSYACGLVQVSFPVFLLATAIGEIPKVGSFTYIGAAAGEVPNWLTTGVLLLPALGVIGLRIVRRRRARAGAPPERQTPTGTIGRLRIDFGAGACRRACFVAGVVALLGWASMFEDSRLRPLVLVGGLALAGRTFPLDFLVCNRCPRCRRSFSDAPEYMSTETSGLPLFGAIESCRWCGLVLGPATR